MPSPLRFTDLFGVGHVEPSVTGLIEVQTTEQLRPDPINDLILLSPFRSGTPLHLRRFRSIAALADTHDPDRTGDQGVALARTAKAAFADQEVFGAADILTGRVGVALPSTCTIKAGNNPLITLTTGDYGNHTRRSRRRITAGTHVGKRITLRDDVRPFVGDDLGVLLSLHYVGDGSACTLTIRRSAARIDYTGQVSDGDTFAVNGVIFEFDDNQFVDGGHLAIATGADAAASFAAAATAITANCPGVTATANPTNDRVDLSAPEEGVVLTLSVGVTFTVAPAGDPASLRTTVTNATDGSGNLTVPLTLPAFKSIAQMAAYINAQLGYRCRVSQYANKFLPSSGLDVLANADIKTAAVDLTGYVAAIVDWVNTQTRGNYTATTLATGTPDEDPDDVFFAGGTTPPVTATDWENALTLVGSQVEKGGILLLDTDDPAIMAMVVAFITEQRSAGKWFRAYCGAAPGLSTDDYLQIAGALDHSRCRLVCQRVGIFGDDGSITYLHPLFLAAALAGGAAGNRPYVNPLTNKRLRFAALHEDDSFDLLTRESLLDGGITVVKREEDRIMVALHVTTSHDPDRRMVRIASEIDTVDMVDANMRQAFLSFRGKWANQNIAGRVFGVGGSVLNFFTTDGAITAGVDDLQQAQPAWRWGNPAYTIEAGVLRLEYQVFVGGELNHVSLHGLAEYQRLVGTLGSGGVQTLSTAVPVR